MCVDACARVCARARARIHFLKGRWAVGNPELEERGTGRERLRALCPKSANSAGTRRLREELQARKKSRAERGAERLGDGLGTAACLPTPVPVRGSGQ